MLSREVFSFHLNIEEHTLDLTTTNERRVAACYADY